MTTLKDMFIENDNDVQELISEELRDQKKYDLPEVGCKKHNFKCAMAGLGFLFGTITVAGVLSSYNSNSEIKESEPVIEDVKVFDEKKDLSYFNSAFKHKEFYANTSNFSLGSFYLNNSKVKSDLNTDYSLKI